ncbi:MAG TPA: SGNH/GDSL hydrolase family protein [Xanthobacteraceae bacterium]|nr:SGNH/GDSL hydrolase family protein [Xanthobacteraceae bacterium]
MRGWIGALALLCAGSPAVAQEPARCAVPEYLVLAEQPLPRVAAAAQARQLNIAVIGSGSTLLSGSDGASAAYPARLEAALGRRLPSLAVKVTPFAKGRQTAQDMVKGFPQIMADLKPDLVVWQTGTVDAIRGVEPDQFRIVLERGIRIVQRARADVILMNMQYSPRTDMLIALGPYAVTMRVVAQQMGVPLFDRLSLMRRWSEDGQFDLYAAHRDTGLAKRVHDCLGKAVAAMIASSGAFQGVTPLAPRVQ